MVGVWAFLAFAFNEAVLVYHGYPDGSVALLGVVALGIVVTWVPALGVRSKVRQWEGG